MSVLNSASLYIRSPATFAREQGARDEMVAAKEKKSQHGVLIWDG